MPTPEKSSGAPAFRVGRGAIWPLARVLLALLLIVPAIGTGRAQEYRTVAQVRQLTPAQAERQLPVKLRGVVTFYSETLFSRFIQDETGGIYVREATPELKPGDVVEVTGTTSPGEYAPVVKPERVEIVGHQPLPAARPVSFDQLASGSQDSQFVQIQGIIRSVLYDDSLQHYTVVLASGGGRLTFYIKELPVPDPEELVDASVRVSGVCSTAFNHQRQLFALRLMVPRRDDLVIETPAPREPFKAPARTIGTLLQFTPQGTYGHRVKLQGIVVLQQLGSLLVIQDEKYGLQVLTRQRVPLQVGDRVEVLGFPRQGQYTPILEDAVYRKISSGPPPLPKEVNVDAALSGIYDCRLITIPATLLDRGRQSREQFLVVESANFIFHAHFDPSADPESVNWLENGSRLAITGVCLIEPGDWQAGDQWRARSFQILMRSTNDIVVLQKPPWWSLRKLLWTVGLLLIVIVLASVWVAVLRRKVNQQTGIIRQQMVKDAALKQRYEDLVENASDVVLTHDLEGHITSINGAGEKLLARSRSELTGASLVDWVAPDQRSALLQWLCQVGDGGQAATAEWDCLVAGGTKVKLEISSRLLPDKPEIESIARDVTERRRLERQLLEVSNREQRRIGHDLHDGVCQQLAAIAYKMHNLGDQLQEANRPEASEAEAITVLINEATVQARSVARGLFPVRLEENGLIAALEELADDAPNRLPVTCVFEYDSPPPRLDADQELHLFYIAQEALVNAAKHGQASLVKILLKRNADHYCLHVQDNGCGFRPDSAAGAGMGIRIMRYRAKVIGAALELKSAPGQGTEIACQFSAAIA